jgi:hypothetical protein
MNFLIQHAILFLTLSPENDVDILLINTNKKPLHLCALAPLSP